MTQVIGHWGEVNVNRRLINCLLTAAKDRHKHKNFTMWFEGVNIYKQKLRHRKKEHTPPAHQADRLKLQEKYHLISLAATSLILQFQDLGSEVQEWRNTKLVEEN